MISKTSELFGIEQLINGIAIELVLAHPNSDEGLVPIYSFIKELCETKELNAALYEGALNVKKVLDNHLDTANSFTQETIDYVRDFVSWAFYALNELDTYRSVSKSFPPLQEPNNSFSNRLDEKDNSIFEDCLMEIDVETDREILIEFQNEAREHLQLAESALIILDNSPKDNDSLNSTFRAFHTIKGVAGFLNLIPIQALSHEVEALLDLARNEKLHLGPEAITLILESKDKIESLVEQVKIALNHSKFPSEIVPVKHTITKIKKIIKNALGNPLTPSSIKGSISEARPLANSNQPFERKGKSGHTQGLTRSMIDSLTIRVNTAKLDNLLDTVGELVIAHSQLETSVNLKANRNNNPLTRNMGQLSRITKELQHTSMSLRMVPIRPTFQKINRVVRDLAQTFQKRVQCHLSGEETELDRNVVEQISDPHIHMVRNSIDHGLESPEERLEAGKSETGNFYLTAYHQGSSIVIEIEDDGRGIDHEKILRIGKEKKLIADDHDLSTQEIYQLIFMPGFSTANKITTVSGRGVGMDVVRKNIEQLHGRIEIESEKGKGTVFKIKLPLTTAIIDGLIVRVGGDRFILPTTSVKVALRPTKENISTIQGKTEVLNLRGQTIPIIRLHQRFSIPSQVTNLTEGILIIMENSLTPFCIFVDEMIGKREIVIKNLGSIMQNIKGISGGAILGDGTIALIIDPFSIQEGHSPQQIRQTERKKETKED